MTVLSLLRATRSPTCQFASQAIAIRTGTNLPKTLTPVRQLVTSLVCRGGHDEENRHFTITPSRYSWNQYKDQFHFYFMLGVIPGLIMVFLVNIFVGPAELAPIPEGYEPKHWEYYRHPISRFLARYFFTSHQEDYERNLFYHHEENEKRNMRLLAWRVEELMSHRGDYPNYYVKPTISGKYMRYGIKDYAYIYEIKGDPDGLNPQDNDPLEK